MYYCPLWKKTYSMASNRNPRSIVLAVVIWVCGCATSTQGSPPFSAAPAPPEGFATVYIYRFGAPPFLQDIKLSLAGKPIQPLPEKGYTWVHVPAGTHTIVAEWPGKTLFGGGWPDANRTHAIEPGKDYFFRLVGSVESSAGGFFSSGAITLRSAIFVRERDAGLAELKACCKYLPSPNLTFSE
jgi:hypothetical protein